VERGRRARVVAWLITSIGVAGVAASLPARTVKNDELARAHPEWHMDRVVGRTGVRSRRIAAPEETALDLGERAARELLGRLGLVAGEVGAVIFCTQTPDHLMPPNACLLQARLGLPTRSIAFDVTLACSGYVYGLYLARALVAAGPSSTVLLVTADTYSRLISPEDRGTMTLFGDGGAATLVRAGTTGRIVDVELGTDGGGADCFAIPAGGARRPRDADTGTLRADRSGNRRTLEQIHMDGAAVLGFVQREVPRNVRVLLARNALQPADCDLVVFHQASRVALDYLSDALAFSQEQVYEDIAEVGNTVSASLPIALRHAEEAGRLRPGMRVLLVAFGVGLSWGSCLLEW